MSSSYMSTNKHRQKHRNRPGPRGDPTRGGSPKISPHNTKVSTEQHFASIILVETTNYSVEWTELALTRSHNLTHIWPLHGPNMVLY